MEGKGIWERTTEEAEEVIKALPEMLAILRRLELAVMVGRAG